MVGDRDTDLSVHGKPLVPAHGVCCAGGGSLAGVRAILPSACASPVRASKPMRAAPMPQTAVNRRDAFLVNMRFSWPIGRCKVWNLAPRLRESCFACCLHQ